MELMNFQKLMSDRGICVDQAPLLPPQWVWLEIRANDAFWKGYP
jgi:hypothetical protein